MNIYSNNKELLSTLGVEGNYSTDFEVRKAILNALGGDASMCNSIYEVDLEILRIYQSGGGGTGGTVVLETANITKNGTYVPSEGYNGFDKAVVNVLPVLETTNITKNGTYTPSSNYDGFDKAIVNVVPVLETANITKNGTYVPSSGYDGFNTVTVNVPIDGGGSFKVLDGMRFGNSYALPESLDTSDVTDFTNMFKDCGRLTTIPLIDTSKCTDFDAMFTGCYSLTSVPQLDTSNGTNFNYMFNRCSRLTNVPQLDTSKGTSFQYMFNSCSRLTTIPQLDLSSGTDFTQMFNGCSGLTTVPQLDTSNGTNFAQMFIGCSGLISIPQLDTSKGTSFFQMFYNCSKLTNITFTGSINYNIDFNDCPSLSYESVKSILTACSNTTKPTTSKTLKFNRTLTDQNGELAALVATCNSKGWTISGLTLE